MRLERFELGTKQKGLALPAVIQRFLAQPVTAQGQRGVATVPQGKGKHADQPLDGTPHPPCFQRRQQRLGIRVATPIQPGAGACRKLAAQIEVVVDFAVVGDHITTARRNHGLMPGRRQIDDRQTLVHQADAGIGINPDARVVRPAVGDGLAHAAQGVRPFATR